MRSGWFAIRPRVALPTGNRMGDPVSMTLVPRTRIGGGCHVELDGTNDSFRNTGCTLCFSCIRASYRKRIRLGRKRIERGIPGIEEYILYINTQTQGSTRLVAPFVVPGIGSGKGRREAGSDTSGTFRCWWCWWWCSCL